MNAPLPFQQFQYDFARHIRSPRKNPRPPGVPARRMQIYNELLFNNLSGFIDACFPVSRSILGERGWTRLKKAFFAEWRSHTPYFREIPREFLRWLMECEAPVSLPAYIVELAHYEWVELAIDVMEAAVPEHVDAGGDLLEGRPVLNPAMMNLVYQWPVHRIGPAFRPRKPAPVQLLVYRRDDGTLSFVEINPVSARLISLLQPGTMTGRAALLELANELPQFDAETVVANGAMQLGSFLQEEIILGTRA